MKPSTTLLGWALAALVGALLVPAALGAVRPDDRSGQLGVGAVAVATQATHPNDQAGALGVGRIGLESQPVAVEASAGTNWGAIGLGAAVAVGVALVAGALIVTTRQHHGPGRPVPH